MEGLRRLNVKGKHLLAAYHQVLSIMVAHHMALRFFKAPK